MTLRFWSLAWASWLTITLGSFAALEWLAYRHRKHPTLSRTLARWGGLQPVKPWGRYTPVLFVGCWLALAAHVVRLARASTPNHSPNHPGEEWRQRC